MSKDAFIFGERADVVRTHHWFVPDQMSWSDWSAYWRVASNHVGADYVVTPRRKPVDLTEDCCEFLLELFGVPMSENDQLWFYSDWLHCLTPRTFEERLHDLCQSRLSAEADCVSAV